MPKCSKCGVEYEVCHCCDTFDPVTGTWTHHDEWAKPEEFLKNNADMAELADAHA